MASSYTTRLRLEKQGTGENDSTWGTLLNTMIDMLDAAIAGRAAVTHDDSASYSLTTANGTTDEARNMILNVGGTLTAARNVVVPAASKVYIVKNATSGGFQITVKTASGTGIVVKNGKTALLFCDGTNVVEGFSREIQQNIQNADYTTVLADGNGHLYHTSGSTHTHTIDSNANVAYPLGTPITFINDGAGVLTIAITSDFLVLAGTGSTGSRSLAQYGMATAVKVASTRWLISGTGLT